MKSENHECSWQVDVSFLEVYVNAHHVHNMCIYTHVLDIIYDSTYIYIRRYILYIFAHFDPSPQWHSVVLPKGFRSCKITLFIYKQHGKYPATRYLSMTFHDIFPGYIFNILQWWKLLLIFEEHARGCLNTTNRNVMTYLFATYWLYCSSFLPLFSMSNSSIFCSVSLEFGLLTTLLYSIRNYASDVWAVQLQDLCTASDWC